MVKHRSAEFVSRRAMLASLGVGSMGLALQAPVARASAANEDLIDHPLTGSWLATTSGGVAPFHFAADGTVLLTWAICGRGMNGDLEFSTPGVGTWESTGERGGYFNVVQVISDQSGAFIGTRSVHGYPVVSDDGKSFVDDGKRVRVYVRDAENTVTEILGEDGDTPSISGIRMGPGSPGFDGPKGSPAEQ